MVAGPGLDLSRKELARPSPCVGSVARRRDRHRREVGLLNQEHTPPQGLRAVQATGAVGMPPIE
eukprot:9518917-Alexandrium_andersonii.AAC.1